MKLWEWDKITTPKIAQNIYINESFFFRWDHIFASDSFANLRKFHTRGYRSNPFLQPPCARIFVSGMLSVSVSMWGESCWMTRSILSTYLERDERKVFLQRNALFSMKCFLYYFSNLSLIRASSLAILASNLQKDLGHFYPSTLQYNYHESRFYNQTDWEDDPWWLHRYRPLVGFLLEHGDQILKLLAAWTS